MLPLGIELENAAELIPGFGQLHADGLEVAAHVLERLRDFAGAAERPEFFIE